MNAQVELPLEPVDATIVQRQPDFKSAIKLCIQVSGKDQKGIAIDLGIDAAQWSRILGGQAHFPENKLELLMDLCGNDIPLEWLAYRRRKGLHMLETEAQRQLRDKDVELTELRTKLAHFMEFAGAAK